MLRLISSFFSKSAPKICCAGVISRTFTSGFPAAATVKKPFSRDILSHQIEESLESPQSYIDFCMTFLRHLTPGHIVNMAKKLHSQYSEEIKRTSYSEKLKYIQAFRLMHKLFYIHENWKTGPAMVSSLLEILSTKELRHEGILTQDQLKEMEKHIVENFPKFYDKALDKCLGTFLDMNYTPELLLETIRKNDEKLVSLSRQTLFTVADKLLGLGAIDEAMFKRICVRAAVLMEGFDITNIMDGLSFLADYYVSGLISSQVNCFPLMQNTAKNLLDSFKGMI